MKSSEIEVIARQRLGDQAEPFLFSSQDIIRWLAEAEDEAAVRASLLFDNLSAFTNVPLVVGVGTYRLDARIDRIASASFIPADGSKPKPVEMTGPDVIHDAQVNMGNVLVCNPLKVAHVGNALQVWPVPGTDAPGSLQLDVYRHPLKMIEGPNDCPEISPVHHAGLVDWILYRAYSTKDSDVYDAQRADRAEAEFIARFGMRTDANAKRRQNERRRVTSPYGGL